LTTLESFVLRETHFRRIMKFLALPAQYRGPACTLGASLTLAFVNFATHSSLLDLLVGSKLRHRFPSIFGLPKWISNITGTPTCVDDVTTAMIGPFPELNDFNAITAMVKLPVILKGVPPECRYWSIQVRKDEHPARHDRPGVNANAGNLPATIAASTR
jgi:hypothetical protein